MRTLLYLPNIYNILYCHWGNHLGHILHSSSVNTKYSFHEICITIRNHPNTPYGSSTTQGKTVFNLSWFIHSVVHCWLAVDAVLTNQTLLCSRVRCIAINNSNAGEMTFSFGIDVANRTQAGLFLFVVESVRFHPHASTRKRPQIMCTTHKSPITATTYPQTSTVYCDRGDHFTFLCSTKTKRNETRHSLWSTCFLLRHNLHCILLLNVAYVPVRCSRFIYVATSVRQTTSESATAVSNMGLVLVHPKGMNS